MEELIANITTEGLTQAEVDHAVNHADGLNAYKDYVAGNGGVPTASQQAAMGEFLQIVLALKDRLTP